MIERIEADLKSALLSGDKQTVSTLKMLKSALTNKRIEIGAELGDEDAMKVFRSETKRRHDAAEMYDKGERPELAAKERSEAATIEAYLPKQLDDAELKTLIGEVKAELGDQAQMGQLIQAVLARADGRTDGRRVSEALRG